MDPDRLKQHEIINLTGRTIRVYHPVYGTLMCTFPHLMYTAELSYGPDTAKCGLPINRGLRVARMPDHRPNRVVLVDEAVATHLKAHPEQCREYTILQPCLKLGADTHFGAIHDVTTFIAVREGQ
jgi:hypothetical protein